MPILEREIEGKVVAWAKKHGFLTPKVKFVEAGYPDRLFISPFGHTIFIEFKVPGAKPDLIQFHRIRELQQRNIPAFWVDSEFEALNVLKAAMEPPSLPGKSDPADVVPIGSRAFPRSGAGQDVSRIGGVENFIRQGFSQAGTDRSPAQGNAEDMAGRINEVGRLRGTNFRTNTRRDESRGDESTGEHTPDKSGGD